MTAMHDFALVSTSTCCTKITDNIIVHLPAIIVLQQTVTTQSLEEVDANAKNTVNGEEQSNASGDRGTKQIKAEPNTGHGVTHNVQDTVTMTESDTAEAQVWPVLCSAFESASDALSSAELVLCLLHSYLGVVVE